MPRREIAAPAKAAADTQAALQEARALLKTADYINARAAVKDLVGAISEQITAVEEAIDARAGRPTRRRR